MERIFFYKKVENDGIDYMGHHRGTPSVRFVGNECNCNKDNLKKMCLNCQNYNKISKKCSSEKQLKVINDSLNPYIKWIKIPQITYVEIIDETNHCDFWKINQDIANKLFK